MKTREEQLAELEEMSRSPINYSDIPPMTEESRETVQFYYKDFLDKLPPEVLKEMVQKRLAMMEKTFPEMVRK